MVASIHRDYIAAGARVIETVQLWRVNAARLSRFGFEGRVVEFRNRAGSTTREGSAAGKDVCIAGSVGPLGISALEAEELKSIAALFLRTDRGVA